MAHALMNHPACETPGEQIIAWSRFKLGVDSFEMSVRTSRPFILEHHVCSHYLFFFFFLCSCLLGWSGHTWAQCARFQRLALVHAFHGFSGAGKLKFLHMYQWITLHMLWYLYVGVLAVVFCISREGDFQTCQSPHLSRWFNPAIFLSVCVCVCFI